MGLFRFTAGDWAVWIDLLLFLLHVRIVQLFSLLFELLRSAELIEGAGKVRQQLLKGGVADLQVKPSASAATVK